MRFRPRSRALWILLALGCNQNKTVEDAGTAPAATSVATAPATTTAPPPLATSAAPLPPLGAGTAGGTAAPRPSVVKLPDGGTAPAPTLPPFAMPSGFVMPSSLPSGFPTTLPSGFPTFPPPPAPSK